MSGNVENLTKWDFGVLDMGKVCDMLEEAMIEIEANGELMLDHDYIMNIFSSLRDQIEPFDEYLTFMFKEKTRNPVSGFVSKEAKVLPFNLLSEDYRKL